MTIIKKYNKRMQSYNGSLKKSFEEWITIQLGWNLSEIFQDLVYDLKNVLNWFIFNS